MNAAAIAIIIATRIEPFRTCVLASFMYILQWSWHPGPQAAE